MCIRDSTMTNTANSLPQPKIATIGYGSQGLSLIHI